jgi:O-antigen/teichoic acid export membrane protein
MRGKRSFLGIGIIYVIGEVLLQGLNFFLLPIYTRHLSSTEYGQVTWVTAISGFVGFFSVLCIFMGYQRFYKECDKASIQKLRNTAFTFSILVGSGFLFVTLVSGKWLAEPVLGFDGAYEVFVYMVLGNLVSQLGSLFIADYYLEYQAFPTVLLNVARLILMVSLTTFFVIVRQEGVAGVFKGQFASHFILLAYFLAMNRKTLRLEIEKEMLWKMLTFSIGLLFLQLASNIMTLSDRYFLIKFRSFEETGIYSIGYRVGMLITPLFAGPFKSIFIPYKYEIWKDGDAQEKFNYIYLQYHLIGSFVVLAVAVYARLLIYLSTTQEYLSAYRIVPLILLSYFIYGKSGFFNLGFELKNKTYYMSAVMAAGGGINILLNFLLIPRLGMTGASMAALLSYAAVNQIYRKAAMALYPVKYDHKKTARIYGILFLLYGAYYVVSSTKLPIGWDFPLGLLLLAAYIGLSLTLKLIQREDLAAAYRLIRNRASIRPSYVPPIKSYRTTDSLLLEERSIVMKKTPIRLHIHLGTDWKRGETSFFKGRISVAGKSMEGKDFAQYFEQVPIQEKLHRLQEVNGFFAYIEHGDWGVFAAVDIVQSIPIFYAMGNREFYLSDDPRWIQDRIYDWEYDEGAKNELLLTRYVTGRDTLYPHIKQLQAGEALFLHKNEAGQKALEIVRYFQFSRRGDIRVSKKELLKEHDLLLRNAFGRLIEWANNRPIVIPLSGGYDSRLIALMLKELGYDQIITFSYGLPNNPEAVVSRQVAQNLGLKWFFIPYDEVSMYQWINSKEWKAFREKADGLRVACSDRDWPAVWELKKRKLIPDNAIFVPGHSGDFISGGHIPRSLYKKRKIKAEELAEYILGTHYTMWNWQGERESMEPQMQQRIFSALGTEAGSIIEDPSNAYERWVWQEFEAKYLINGIRVYEYWGYEWWMPLWDREYAEFWKRVPRKWCYKERLYKEYVINLYAKLAGISLKEARRRNDTPTGTVRLHSLLLASKNRLSGTALGRLLKRA